MDLLLGNDHDLAIGANGDLSLVTGRDAIAQHLSVRLRTFRGEWRLDERVGLPYFQSILVKAPNMAVVRSIYRRAILSTPGVTSLEGLTVSLDYLTRTLSVSFRAQTTDGPLDFSEEVII